MYKSKKILGVIPARGHNDEIDHLNIKKLSGKPMIEYTISKALNSGLIDEVIVSTEDKKIAKIAKLSGASVPFLRPQKLTRDNVTLFEIAKYVYWKLNKNFDFVVILLPNSPFRTEDDINNAIWTFTEKQYDYLLSVVKVKDFFWKKNDGSIIPVTHKGVINRKNAEVLLREQGGIYIFNSTLFGKKTFNAKKIGYFELGEHNSRTINSIYDLFISEKLIRLPITLINELIKAS